MSSKVDGGNLPDKIIEAIGCLRVAAHQLEKLHGDLYPGMKPFPSEWSHMLNIAAMESRNARQVILSAEDFVR